MVKILSLNQIKQVEDKANEGGITFFRLMENAGSACAKIIRNRFDDTGLRRVSVVCGKGKNGGDGFVIARKLHENGYKVRVILAHGEPQAENAKEMYARVKDLGIDVEFYSPGSENQKQFIQNSDIIVDCIFGTGFKGYPDADTAELFDIISSSGGTVISIDLPSGLYTDSSEIGSTAVKADITITVIGLKYSLVYYPSAEFAGEIKVASIGIPEEVLEGCDSAYTLNFSDIKSKFTARDENANKGDFGKALIIAGSYEMPGAAVLASSACIGSGAGLVKLAFPDKAYPAVASQCPEKVLVPLPCNEQGRISSLSFKRISDELKKCDAVLIGCGLGNDSDILSLTELVLSSSEVPVILDADALNALKGRAEIIKEANAPVIITPHPGEAARLLGIGVPEVQSDRLKAAEKLYELTGATVVLKGSRTVVTRNGRTFYINMTGNSGMATAGSGDVLAGLIASMLCQKMSPFVAAVSGVYIHGLAGDSASGKYSKMGVTASKIINELPSVLTSFEK